MIHSLLFYYGFSWGAESLKGFGSKTTCYAGEINA